MPGNERYAGKDVYATFGGTVISGDITSFKRSGADDQVDVTAGAETFHYYLSLGRVDGTGDIEVFYNGATVTVWNAMAPGAAGTLIVGPMGTASGKPKWTWSRALVANRDITVPFDDAITVSASFQFSSACSETTY